MAPLTCAHVWAWLFGVRSAALQQPSALEGPLLIKYLALLTSMKLCVCGITSAPGSRHCSDQDSDRAVPSAQMGVHQFVFPGVITLADGEFEAVLLYLYIKGLREPHAVNFRGFLFAQSAERAWYNWGETGLCQPYVAKDWLPRVWLRCAR